MKTVIHHSIDARKSATDVPQFPPLELVTKPNLTTAELAYYTDRAAQTCRGWACHQNGPIQPRRIHGRLAWPTADLRRVLGVEAAK